MFIQHKAQGIYQAEVCHLIQQIHLQIMMELDMLMTNPLLVAGANNNLQYFLCFPLHYHTTAMTGNTCFAKVGK